MKTGLIYKAENVINGKVYIGQTTSSLKERIKGHYKDAKRKDYKFSRALNKYNKEDWKWEILEENIITLELDDKEIKYITEFNSYKNGYNSTTGGDAKGSIRDTNMYEIYRPDVGLLKLTKKELYELDNKLATRLWHLVKGNKLSVNGYVLGINKDKYEEILKIYHLYHPDYGIISSTYSNFYNNYFNCKTGFHALIQRRNHVYKGWVLAENKNNYNKILNILTLEHPEFGKHTLPGKEFTKQFNLKRYQIYKLKHKLSSEINGWKLVTDI